MLKRLPSEITRTSKPSPVSPSNCRRMGSERLTTGLEPMAMPISATCRAREPWIFAEAISMSKEITRRAVMVASARIAINQMTASKAAPRRSEPPDGLETFIAEHLLRVG